jgi:8-oxo-dGTP pyrophosphatase MutT (NUDIX family)
MHNAVPSHRAYACGGSCVAGGVEPGETSRAAAEGELGEETGLVATVEAEAGIEVVECVDPLTKEPRRHGRGTMRRWRM